MCLSSLLLHFFKTSLCLKLHYHLFVLFFTFQTIQLSNCQQQCWRNSGGVVLKWYSLYTGWQDGKIYPCRLHTVSVKLSLAKKTMGMEFLVLSGRLLLQIHLFAGNNLVSEDFHMTRVARHQFKAFKCSHFTFSLAESIWKFFNSCESLLKVKNCLIFISSTLERGPFCCPHHMSPLA